MNLSWHPAVAETRLYTSDDFGQAGPFLLPVNRSPTSGLLLSWSICQIAMIGDLLTPLARGVHCRPPVSGLLNGRQKVLHEQRIAPAMLGPGHRAECFGHVGE